MTASYYTGHIISLWVYSLGVCLGVLSKCLHSLERVRSKVHRLAIHLRSFDKKYYWQFCWVASGSRNEWHLQKNVFINFSATKGITKVGADKWPSEKQRSLRNCIRCSLWAKTLYLYSTCALIISPVAWILFVAITDFASESIYVCPVDLLIDVHNVKCQEHFDRDK